MFRVTYCVVLLASALLANKVDPPVGKTGAPGETTCSSCHSGTSNPGAVVMEFGSLTYSPGVQQTIRIHVLSKNYIYTGMQITARLASNELQQAGTFQAGEFTSVRTQNGLQYVSQNVTTGTAVFTVTWTPPATNVGNVRFYASGVFGTNGTTAEPNAFASSYTMAPGSGSLPQGYRWQTVSVPGLTNPTITALSSDGRWAGTHSTGAFTRDTNGTVTTFTAPPQSFSLTPMGINSSGKVVGYYTNDTGHQLGFIREPNGTFTSFAVPGAGGTQLVAINDAGVITGNDSNFANAFQMTAPPAFTFVDSSTSLLRTAATTNGGKVLQYGIGSLDGVLVVKNGSDMAGISSCPDPRRTPFLWAAINDNNEYVAYCSFFSGGTNLTYWTGSGALNRRIVLSNTSAETPAISGSGQITTSREGERVLLTPCAVAPTVTTITAPGGNGQFSVPVTTALPDCSPTVVSDVDWILARNDGLGGVATFTTLSNTTGAARTGTVWVAGVAVTVTQPTGPCVLSLSAIPSNYASAGGSGQLSVLPPLSCPWTATSDASWITLTGTTSGSSTGLVPFTVAPNPGAAARSGTITVGVYQAVIFQSGNTVCNFAVTPAALNVPATGTNQTFNVSTGAGCVWTFSVPGTWIAVLSNPTTTTGNGSVVVTVLPNTSADPRSATLTIAGQNITVFQSGAGTPVSGLRFVPVNPCRLLETRTQYAPAYQTGAYGPPSLNAGSTRTIQLNGLAQCGLPAGTKAAVFNVTLVPRNGGPADFVTIYPTGEAQPDFWTIRSPDGQTVANTAIVKVGNNNSINVYTSNDTDLLIDTFGYFTDSTLVSNLAYYPVTPCRVVETRAAYRTPAGPFGPPTFTQGETRRFKFPGNGYCNVPAGATAYSVTLTAVPPGPLAYITTWAAGLAQPTVSNMNSFAGRTLANNLIVPVSTDGSMDVFAYNATDILIDINGYFAPDDGTGLFYYPVGQCRAVDTRSSALPSPFGAPAMATGETRVLPIPSSTTNCNGIPSNAKAFVVNATVQPGGSPMPFLTMWAAGSAQPNASQLNAFEGQTVTNTAIVPAGTLGNIQVYTYRQTNLVLDISGYFAR